jgi:N-acetylneuraminate synthase
MRIFCLCNNWLGWRVLKWLNQQQDQIVGVAVHPETRANKGLEIRSETTSSNCVLIDGSRLKEPAVLEQVRKLEADIAVSILFGYVLSAEFVEIFPQGCINLHPALLPHNRGAHPNVWSIVSKTPAGVTLHYIDAGIDTGDVIAQKDVPVLATDTGASLYRRLEMEGLELFKNHWAAIRAGRCARNPQAAGVGSGHRARDLQMIDEIDPQRMYRAEDLINLIRARTFAPYPGAYFLHGDKKIYLRLDLQSSEEDDREQDLGGKKLNQGRSKNEAERSACSANTIRINGRTIGVGHPVYVIAEVSANHHQDFEQAVKIIRAARDAGVDAVKLQTYTPDTITIQCDRAEFRIAGGTIWDGRTLYELYGQAYTPWEWQPRLKQVANDLGLDLFSTPFDATAVDFLEEMNVPAHKLASFELVDIPLIQKIARTGKPLIISTGMSTLEEIEEAVQTARQAGATQIALLKCTSAYPALPEEMNLRTIPDLARQFNVPVGLSDHSMGSAVAGAAVALGACIIEKHLTLSRAQPGPDSVFSLEPHEFKAMVDAVRVAERALGEVHFGIEGKEVNSRVFRRSLFVVQGVKRGEPFTAENVRSIRPGYGLHTRHLPEVLGRNATRDIERGTPVSWDLVGRDSE